MNRETQTVPRSAIWDNLLVFVAFGKAVAIGATLGLALLGALDVAFAATAQEWVSEFQTQYFDSFAIGGAVAGFAGKLVSSIYS